MMQDDKYREAMDKALRYLGFRARSRMELRQYLARKDYEEAVIDEVLERLQDYGYVNDAQFARSMASSQSNFKRKGSRVVEQKLYQAGVDKETAQMALEEIDEEQELENARYWAAKIGPALAGEEPQKRRQKMFRRLSSKGFSYDVVSRACREWESLADSEESFDGNLDEG